MWMRNGGVGMRSDRDDKLSACGEAGDQQDSWPGNFDKVIRSRVDAPSDKPFPISFSFPRVDADSDSPELRNIKRLSG
jgi:hypothetical protein